MLRYLIIQLFLLYFSFHGLAQQVEINIRTDLDRKPISPYLYGRNNSFSNVFGTPTTNTEITLYKEAGLRFARENTGNNSTKYNWRRKISSHPDWYNNVYDHDWDYAMEVIEENMPGIQTMWAFQLIGKVAANKDHNFNDWGYNQSQWWEGVAQNLAGGGVINSTGGHDAQEEGDPNLYLMDWPADSTTEILNHWFGEEGIGLNPNQAQYWSMDNEPEIWSGTHDDVMPTLPEADVFLDKYIEVAKKAREKFPEIKLVGPVPANEWQWYKWGDESLRIDGQYYPWLEYFIKRIADEQQASGIRLLDVLDIHWYPGETSPQQIVQIHRVFYDETYSYPGANGLRTINGGWDTSLTNESIFKRIEGWLEQYFGENHGIALSMSEFGANSDDANVNAVLYASMLGTFANHEVEIFTPWTWKVGMWETLHLFSRYAKSQNVTTESSSEDFVSAYSSMNEEEDSMTVILVNRDISSTRNVRVNVGGFMGSGVYNTLQIASLPQSETFVSHTQNALNRNTISLSNGSFDISLPPLSVTAVVLTGEASNVLASPSETQSFVIFPNPSSEQISIQRATGQLKEAHVKLYNEEGKELGGYLWPEEKEVLTIPVSGLKAGLYFIEVQVEDLVVHTDRVVVE